jgi:pre-mRNA-splicing factor CWC22
MKEGIEDRTDTNLVNLCCIIYLTIMNALNYEEAVHKLLKIQLQEGHSTFYGLIGEHFCKLNRVWTDSVEEAFKTYLLHYHPSI